MFASAFLGCFTWCLVHVSVSFAVLTNPQLVAHGDSFLFIVVLVFFSAADQRQHLQQREQHQGLDYLV